MAVDEVVHREENLIVIVRVILHFPALLTRGMLSVNTAEQLAPFHAGTCRDK